MQGGKKRRKSRKNERVKEKEQTGKKSKDVVLEKAENKNLPIIIIFFSNNII